MSATIVGEFLVSTQGVGRYIEGARQVSDTTGVFAGVVIALALVLVDQRDPQRHRALGAALAAGRTGHGIVVFRIAGERRTMKLASYIVDGTETFGVVRGNDVITMNGRFGGRGATLRDALAADLLPQIKDSVAQAPSPTTSSPTSNSCR